MQLTQMHQMAWNIFEYIVHIVTHFSVFSDVKLDIYNYAEVKNSSNVMGVIRGSVEPGGTSDYIIRYQ